MRLTRLYQMYDTEAAAVHGQIIANNRNEPSIRAFHDVLKNPETLPGQHPEHFELRMIGVLDEETGQLTAEQPPLVIATGEQWTELHKRQQEA